MKLSHIIGSIALSLIAAIPAYAQDLHQEIEIDHDIEPVEHDVNKLNITPAVSLPPLAPVKLTLNERAVSTTVTPLIPFLEPAAYADSLYVTPYRGYFAGGICPLPVNVALSAGYRLVDTDRVRLSVWGQFDSQNYKKDLAWKDESRYWRDNTLTAGLDLRWAIGRKALLKAAVDYTFDRYKEIYQYNDLMSNQEPVNPRFYQTINMLNVNFNFGSHVGGLNYNASLRVNHTGARRGAAPSMWLFYYQEPTTAYPDIRTEPWKPVRQNTIDLNGTATLSASESSSVGLDLGATIIHTSPHAGIYKTREAGNPVGLLEYDSENKGLFTITPRYVLDKNRLRASIGARLQFSANAGRVINITPDVNIGWTPTSMFGIDARVTGGVETNTLEHLYGVCQYFNPSLAYGFSRVPFDASARATLGPFQGGYIELNAGYSKACHWLMPLESSETGRSSTVAYAPTDIKGWRYGAAIGYNWKEKIKARIEYTGVPGNNTPDKGYYLWRDRARHQLQPSATVKLIPRLSISADYTLRAGRRFIDRYQFVDAAQNTSTVVTRTVRLANTSVINIGADYECGDRLNIFARGENLLNRTTYDIALHPDAGLTVYIGASYLF